MTLYDSLGKQHPAQVEVTRRFVEARRALIKAEPPEGLARQEPRLRILSTAGFTW